MKTICTVLFPYELSRKGTFDDQSLIFFCFSADQKQLTQGCRAVARLQNKTRQVSSAEGASRYGGWGHAPPPSSPENFEIYSLRNRAGEGLSALLRNALVTIFRGIFFFRKVNLGQVSKFTFLLLSDAGAKLMTICISKHSNVVTRIIKIKWIHESTQRLWILYCRLIKRSFR